MNCDEAAEFVSALCDGETVPPAAAEHIGGCSACRAHLQEYLAMGAELRRVASLEPAEQVTVRSWSSNQTRKSTWWTKGWESMRIPRFAFALLLIAIAGLASSLVLVRARAQEEGNVLSLKASLPDGHTAAQCMLSLADKKNDFCAWLSPPRYLLGVKILAHTADQVELGIRAQFNNPPYSAGEYLATLDDLHKIPEKPYWFRPSEKLEIEVPGSSEKLVLTGELTDHIPPFVDWAGGVQMDPKPGELQVASPLLLRSQKVVFDFELAASIAKDYQAVQIYMPGQGLWFLSLRPLEGAVEATVDLNRVKFEMDGQPYTFLMAAPVSREQHIWVLHDPNYAPSDPVQKNGFMGNADPDHLVKGVRLQ